MAAQTETIILCSLLYVRTESVVARRDWGNMGENYRQVPQTESIYSKIHHGFASKCTMKLTNRDSCQGPFVY